MNKPIALIPIRGAGEELVTRLMPEIEERFGLPCTRRDPIPHPENALNHERGQYLARVFLRALQGVAPANARATLGVCDLDLYAQGLNFVFGEAEPARQCAIISLARLRQTFWAGKPSSLLLFQRAVKEAVHELGHLFFLAHCARRTCVMHFSNCLADTDRKGPDFCSACQTTLNDRLRQEGFR